ncbi:MAG: hypothetical protein IT196_24740 [Acidimicrobiales bacterium]|nr:hypothetical protein [Acidimicrobiales bacterium]
MARLDRRVPIFAVMAAVCFLLIPVAESGLRYVPFWLGCAYAVLSVLFLVDWLVARRR